MFGVRADMEAGRDCHTFPHPVWVRLGLDIHRIGIREYVLLYFHGARPPPRAR